MIKIKEYSIGDCPICGGSLKGPSFLYIYLNEYKKAGIDISNDKINEIIKQRFGKQSHQSLLIECESGKFFCPHCKNQISNDNE